jgi:branched-subunit amino acid transport protein
VEKKNMDRLLAALVAVVMLCLVANTVYHIVTGK